MKDVIKDNYKLMLGDCLDRMKDIPDESVDLILTDPPYQTTQNKWDSMIDLEEMCNWIVSVNLILQNLCSHKHHLTKFLVVAILKN